VIPPIQNRQFLALQGKNSIFQCRRLWDLPIFFFQVFLQQRLSFGVHTVKLPGDRMLRAKLPLCQPLDPPDVGKEPADLSRDVPAILLGQKIQTFRASFLGLEAIIWLSIYRIGGILD
jgi:hypothetical protein